MKFRFFYLLICLMVSCEQPTMKISAPEVITKLEDFYKEENFFKLREVYTKNTQHLSPRDSLYYRAIITNVFNRVKESNEAITNLLESHQESLSDNMLNQLYGKKLWNHINLYEYGEAAQTSDHILQHYHALNDSNKVEDLENEIKIWRALKDIPKQEIAKTGDAAIPMTRDKVGLFNVDVDFGEDKGIKNLLFDTGANFSFIRRSLAEELGYPIIEADFYVTAATGKKVDSDIAIADEIDISGIRFKNVFFLVFNDEDLSFPQIDYHINGAIGFPVIEAMDEIRIRKDREIFVPGDPADYAFNNLALNGLMPVLAVEYGEDTLRFTFDTGATSTSLYPKFYEDYKAFVEDESQKKTFTAAGGGGAITFEGYLIDHLNFKVGDSEARLDSLELHIDHIGGEESNFHGNFGQDYISQFEEMVISFKYGSLLFRQKTGNP